MADRCEHGARRGNCDIPDCGLHKWMIETLERALANLGSFDTSCMTGVDVIFLGHTETDIAKVVKELKEPRR